MFKLRKEREKHVPEAWDTELVVLSMIHIMTPWKKIIQLIKKDI